MSTKKDEALMEQANTEATKLDLLVQPTPNPNALKFILPKIVKAEGKSTYEEASTTGSNTLAGKLFTIRGVDQVHFFQNVITISKFGYITWDELEPNIIKCIEENLDAHDPNYKEFDAEKERRNSLSPELQRIEDILDHEIRPGLQGDGGDLQCISLDKNVLIIKYEGACGTCPSSTMGTLEAIKAILRDQFDPGIEVYTVAGELA